MTDNRLGGGATYELLIHEPDPHINGGYNLTTYDMRDWSRWREIVDYAKQRDTTIAEAIHRLVNSGLSHL